MVVDVNEPHRAAILQATRRRADGARRVDSARNQSVLSQTTRPVLYGLLGGVGLTASLATVLIATLDPMQTLRQD